MSKFRLGCTKSELDRKTSKSPETPCKHCPKEKPPDNRPCSCEVTARALSDDVPKFLGLKNLRAALERDQNIETNLNPQDPKDPTKDPKDPTKDPKDPTALKDTKPKPECSENSKPAENENKQPDVAPSK